MQAIALFKSRPRTKRNRTELSLEGNRSVAVVYIVRGAVSLSHQKSNSMKKTLTMRMCLTNSVVITSEIESDEENFDDEDVFDEQRRHHINNRIR